MSGKPTHRDGRHPSRIGRLVEAADLTERDWSILEECVGKLDTAERETVTEVCEIARDMALDDSASRADVRATLTAITKETDDAALLAAYKNCDNGTQCEIDRARYRMDGAAMQRIELRPAKIRAASWLALQIMPKLAGGAPSKAGWRRYLVESISPLLSAKGVEPHASDDHPSVKFLSHLIWTSDPNKPAEDITVARKLLAEVLASSHQTHAK